MGKHILLVDDDPLFRVSTSFSLKTAGYQITTAANVAETLDAIQQSLPDIILLDIGLPETDGLEVLRIIQQYATIPTIFVTARRRELDEIVGLELGADDYITKPFDMDVLLAHIKAVLRRTAAQTTPRGFGVGDLYIDAKTHTVVLNGKTIEMSRKEFDLLHVMAQKPGEIFSIDELMNQVWGEDWFGEMQTIYVHIRRLREKIEEDPAQPRRLLSVKGVGYKLVPVRE